MGSHPGDVVLFFEIHRLQRFSPVPRIGTTVKFRLTEIHRSHRPCFNPFIAISKALMHWFACVCELHGIKKWLWGILQIIIYSGYPPIGDDLNYLNWINSGYPPMRDKLIWINLGNPRIKDNLSWLDQHNCVYLRITGAWMAPIRMIWWGEHSCMSCLASIRFTPSPLLHLAFLVLCCGLDYQYSSLSWALCCMFDKHYGRSQKLMTWCTQWIT